MNKFQKLKFRSVAEFLEYLPKDQLEIVNLLRELIIETMPDANEKLAYNVPFYYLNKRVCYIWPAAVPWGGLKEGVALGFCQAALIINIEDYFSFGEKKEIASRTFHSIEEIDKNKIKLLLRKAVKVDRELIENSLKRN